MFRLVRSAFRTADHFVTSGTTRLKKPLENLLLKVERNVSNAAHTSQSFSSTFSHQLHTQSVARPQPITSSFSFPTRVALARSPLAAPKLPRAPTVPRSISEVGLGTARNFSSSRHVFQNIIDNVPIHTRALWEVEWDLKQKKAAQKKAIRRDNKKQQAERIPDKVKAKENVRAPLVASVATDNDAVYSTEFSTYFAAPTNPSLTTGVTTTLTIPLYPPPARSPLPASAPDDTFFAKMLDIHTSHSTHATRVTSLFTRLDGAEVWSSGARCDHYGELNTGMPTSLKVVFDGWTQERVRRVLGDAGKGWCELVEEERAVEPTVESPPLQPTFQSLPDELDVTSSFILPTLDFSSHFSSHITDDVAPTTRATSPIDMLSPVHSDEEFDFHDGYSSGGEEFDRMSDVSIAATPVHRSLGFSVDFLERSGHTAYGDDTRSYY